MSKYWLLVDTNYLCYRALHSTGDLSYQGQMTGVAYGVLREIQKLHDLFSPVGTVFCFDSKTYFRREIYPEYKNTPSRKRKIETPEDADMWAEFSRQVKELRTTLLPKMGFTNVACVKGFESDDLIASYSFNLPHKQRALIVSNDHDLYQCIGKYISIWQPIDGKKYTLQCFREEFGVHPQVDWPQVKAIAGCSSDNIPGIKGIGEKTACKWIRQQLKKDSVAFKKIEEGLSIIVNNLRLVKLPYEDCPTMTATEDGPINWNKAARILGARTLRRA